MIDNFEQISELLSWEDSNDFYFVQILKRKKENPELSSNSYVVKTYYITSLDNLNFYKEEMKMLAKFHNARVYINLNKRNFEKCSLQTARIILDQIANKDYKSSRKAFNTICGKYSSDTDKKWIIDVDDNSSKKFYDWLKEELDKLQPIGPKFITHIDTKNGYHIISKPFNLAEFNELFRDKQELKPDVHKQNPTILYML